jgi:hypothetical protein
MKRLFFTILLLSTLLVACGGNAQETTTPEDVIAAFKTAGLEAEDSYAMTKEDYGLAPVVCDGYRFLIPSLGEDSGGRVYVCSDADEQAELVTFYTELGKSPLFFSWVFEKGNVVVQINGELDEVTAKKYEAAIP